MTELEFKLVAETYDFREVSEIVARGDILRFADMPNGREKGHVYLWAEVVRDSFRVVYVGKAGKTLADRFRQHEGGFKRSTTGLAHAARIRDGLARDRKYLVYARKSETRTLCDEPGISMALIEEAAFIKKFDPEWNSAKGLGETLSNAKDTHHA